MRSARLARLVSVLLLAVTIVGCQSPASQTPAGALPADRVIAGAGAVHSAS